MEEEYIIQPNNDEVEVEVQDEPEPVAPESATDAIDEKSEINRLLD